MEEFNICFQPGFLRVLYLAKFALNLVRFIVPIALVIKVGIDLYKGIIKPDDKEGQKKIWNRIFAAVIIFILPTIINFVMGIVKYSYGEDKFAGAADCWEWATTEYIAAAEAARDQKLAATYLLEEEKKLSNIEKGKLIIERLRSEQAVDNSSGPGEYANNTNTITCGSGPTYNSELFSYVRSSGLKTRNGVVAAATYLSSRVNVHIPYFWSGGHFHGYTYNGSKFSDSGDNFMGLSKYWGCNVKLTLSPGTPKQPTGGTYKFGMDCSGFTAWAILNGGYYNGESDQSIRIYTSSSRIPQKSISGIDIDTSTVSDSKGKVKAGDIVWKYGHVGMVIRVMDNKLVIAEEQGTDYGLVVSEIGYNDNRFTHVLLMDNFYANYQKGKTIWSGFNGS